MEKVRNVRVGKIQVRLLNALREHGYWRNGCGWVYDTNGHTKKMLERLVEKGLVYRDETGRYMAI